MTLKDEPSRSVGGQYITEEKWRNSYRSIEEAEPKQKQCPAVVVSGGETIVQWCKEQYCIGTWNVKSMNQGKLDVVKQEMARVNITILGISELAKFRLKLKKTGKTTTPFRYDLNKIPYDCTVEVTNRFKGKDLIERVPEELWMEVYDIVQEAGIKTSPRKRNAKRQNDCLRRPFIKK